MLNLNCKITVGKWSFDYVTQLSITASADMFSSTANIKLPQKFYDNSKYNLFNEIAIGDEVKIKVGYYPNIETRFVGYVSKRVPNSPLEIHCENESWQYKQKILEPLTIEDATLGDLIEQIYSVNPAKTKIYEPERKIGDWRIAKSTTFLKVLDALRQKFGISAFWDFDGVLNIDQQFKETSPVAGVFHYDTDKANIIDISNMTYQEAAEFSQVVKGVSIQDTLDVKGQPNKPITIFSFYDELGNIQSSTIFSGQGNVNNFNLPYLTAAELTKLTETKLKALNFTGYRGGFKTFGEPIISVNDDVEIFNDKQKEMQGRYRVRAVTINYGIDSGYRQDIQVALKTGVVI